MGLGLGRLDVFVPVNDRAVRSDHDLDEVVLGGGLVSLSRRLEERSGGLHADRPVPGGRPCAWRSAQAGACRRASAHGSRPRLPGTPPGGSRSTSCSQARMVRSERPTRRPTSRWEKPRPSSSAARCCSDVTTPAPGARAHAGTHRQGAAVGAATNDEARVIVSERNFVYPARRTRARSQARAQPPARPATRRGRATAAPCRCVPA